MFSWEGERDQEGFGAGQNAETNSSFPKEDRKGAPSLCGSEL
jgi:hypothetical protein